MNFSAFDWDISDDDILGNGSWFDGWNEPGDTWMAPKRTLISHEARIIVLCVYGFLAVSSLIGNILFCLVIWRAEKLRNVTNLFMSTLGIANLIFTIFSPPMFLTRRGFYINDWPFGWFLCKFCSSVSYLTATASFYAIAMISIDRWLMIFTKRWRLNVKVATALVVIVWLVSVAVASPYFYLHDTIIVDGLFGPEMTRCKLECANCKKTLQAVVVIIQYLIPLVIIVPCDIHLAVFVWRRPDVGANTSERWKKNQQKRRRTVLVLLSIICLYIICWSPLLLHALFTMFQVWTLTVREHLHSYLALYIVASLAMSLTPVLYLLNDTFRIELMRLMRCLKPSRSAISETWRTHRMFTQTNVSTNRCNNSNVRKTTVNESKTFSNHDEDVSSAQAAVSLLISRKTSQTEMTVAKVKCMELVERSAPRKIGFLDLV